MKTVKISLNSIDKVKSFVNDITKFDYDFTQVNMEIFKLEEQFDEMEKIFLEKYCGVENE